MTSSYLKVRLARSAICAASVLALFASGEAAAVPPSGEVQFGNAVVEPAYDDRDGSVVYLLTPESARVNVNPDAVAPLYVILYPSSVAGAIGTVICQHQPMDNCPDHGPALAGLAQAVAPDVYGDGVWGHDHLISAPGGKGGDFHVAWMPVAVVFNTAEAAAHHITTAAQLNLARALGQVTEIALPPATFHGSPVSAAVYQKGTSVMPAPPLP